MKTFYMGLNTEPDWLKADEVIARWKANGNGNEEIIERWEKARVETKALRDEIAAEVETNGIAELSWSCMGETRHTMHSQQWAKAMPEYDFEISRYKCIVRKKAQE